MADDIDAIDMALAAMRDRINQTPPPPDKEALIAAYNDLFRQFEIMVANESHVSAAAVTTAAQELKKVVDSAHTDPLDIFLSKLGAVKQQLDSAIAVANAATGAPLQLAAGGAALPASGPGLPLSQAGLENACQQLGVKAAEIWAIIFTETDPPYCGNLADGRPQILYERHIFSRLTQNKYDQVNPSVSHPSPGNYGAAGAHQYDRLAEAMKLDASAALQSASWGIGQTLGTNYKAIGFASPQEMVTAMFYSEDLQLLAAVREITSSHIATALAAHDWKKFASVYNGPTYWKNNYDVHLLSWYTKFSNGALPDLRIRAAQVYLMYLGYDPSTIDGAWGKRTRSAWNSYQTKIGVPPTDEIDDQTFLRLVKDGQAAVQKSGSVS